MRSQRLRFRYKVTPEATGLGHRDIAHAWEAAVKAAGLTVAASEGKRPAALISLAAPLPKDATSDAEIADIVFESRVEPGEALRSIAPHLPPGLIATEVREIGVNAAAVQASLRWAEWEVAVLACRRSEDDVRAAIEGVLSAKSIPMEYKREKKTREYDLRPLILDVRLLRREGETFVLAMRLRAEQDRTARADQTLLALGFAEPLRVHRTKLEVDRTSAAVREFRRQRQPKEV
jgi:radical SAM-linked protein